MAEPTLSSVHINRPLTDISTAYLAQASDYLADKIWPVVPVQKKSDLYFRYTKGYWYRDEAQERAPATESAGGGYGVDTASYLARVYAFHIDVDPQVRANTDVPLNADRDATIFISQRMMLQRERQVLGQVFQTSTWTGSSTGSDITPSPQWDLANSTPVEDIIAQIWAMKQNTGRFPNKFVLGPRVWEVLQNHDEVIQRIKYTQRGVITTDLLASLIAPPGVPNFEVLVAASIYNTNPQGQSDSFSFIAPTKDAWLGYAEPQPGIMVPSSGYIFTWQGLLGAGSFGTVIQQIPMPWLGVGTIRTEGQLAYDAQTVGLDLGAYFHNAVSA